ncbi:MAG: hypothetical protein QM691_16945 [Opitutaceae bacterium]
MRFVFLGSSLAPGRNGVGDYIRCLSAELARQGHSALAIGLADTEDALDDRDPVVRLARRRPWAQRLQHARAAIAAFAPDWISLQFVAYAWHPRGYAFGLAERIEPLLGGRRRHLMFHELWVGLNRRDRVVNRLHGILQRHAVLRLHRAFAPQIVHTQTPAYVATLAAEGIVAKRLPLFGNLPVAPGDRAATRRRLLEQHATGVDPRTALFAGWFGTVHPEWDGPEAVARLADAAQKAGRPLVLVALGRTGFGGAALLNALRRNPPRETIMIELGETSPADASQVLGALDLALTPNPVALAPKSGTVAACLDHGLPVLVSRDDWQPRGPIVVPPSAEPLLVYSPAGTALDLSALLALRRAPAPRLPGIAKRFVEDLTAGLGVRSSAIRAES